MRLILFSSIAFLTVAHVERAHSVALERGGGLAGTRDRGLLESAVMQPRSGHYRTLAEMAAVYAHGIVKNHAFADANKRTALIASGAFLQANGYALTLVGAKSRLHPWATWADLIEFVAASAATRAELLESFIEEMGEPGEIEFD